MAIRNANLGGTDWTTSEVPLKAVDLNDTFDAAVTALRTNPAFWMSSTTYDVYEDFDSLSTGTFAGNGDWVISYTGEGSSTWCSISSTQNAGGSGNELLLNAPPDSGVSSAGTITATASTLVEDRHVFARVYWDGTPDANGGTSYFQFSINGTNYYTLMGFGANTAGDSTGYSNILVVANGSNSYDVYAGGKLLADDVSTSTLTLSLRVARGVSASGLAVYIDDIRQTKSDS